MQTTKEIFVVPDYWEAEIIVEHPFIVEYQGRIYHGVIKATRGSSKELYSWGITWVGPSPDFRNTSTERKIAEIDPYISIDVNSFAEDVIEEIVCHLISPGTNSFPKELARFIPGLKVALGSQEVAAHTWYILIPADAVVGDRIVSGQLQIGYDSFMSNNVGFCFVPREQICGMGMSQRYIDLIQESSRLVADVFLKNEVGISLSAPGQQVGRALLEYIKKRRIKNR